MSDRLTLDYGMRFVHQQAQADDLEQGWASSRIEWRLASAPRLYVAGCANGVAPCTGNNRQAMDPLTGVFRDLAPRPYRRRRSRHRQSPQRSVAPGDGIRHARPGLAGPPRRAALRYRRTTSAAGSHWLSEAGSGLFYGRGFEQNLVANPPATLDVTVRASTLQSIGPEGLSNLPFAGPSLVAKQYDAGYPTDAQWNTGVQVMLPFSTAIDLAYVGHHGWNEVIDTNIGAVDIGAAFRPENQDPTVAPSTDRGRQRDRAAAAVTLPRLQRREHDPVPGLAHVSCASALYQPAIQPRVAVRLQRHHQLLRQRTLRGRREREQLHV